MAISSGSLPILENARESLSQPLVSSIVNKMAEMPITRLTTFILLPLTF
ncbi:MAG: hypothetical protein P8I90_08570 [Glaciecola sp.]|nr:hypothetical protein [Glaciecola sp.]